MRARNWQQQQPVLLGSGETTRRLGREPAQRASGLLLFLFAVRFLRLLGTLARAIRCAHIIRVFVVFLHGELKIKQQALNRK